MKKYELIANLEVNLAKSKDLIDKFLDNFDEWDKYEDEFINEEKVEIIKDKSKWNEEYLRKHISLLFSNFSKERLAHIKEVIEYLYREDDEIEEIEKESIFDKKKNNIINNINNIVSDRINKFEQVFSTFRTKYNERDESNESGRAEYNERDESNESSRTEYDEKDGEEKLNMQIREKLWKLSLWN